MILSLRCCASFSETFPILDCLSLSSMALERWVICIRSRAVVVCACHFGEYRAHFVSGSFPANLPNTQLQKILLFPVYLGY